MKVKEIMSSPVYAVLTTDSVARARNLMMRHKVRGLVVIENDEIAGIFTSTDLERMLGEQNSTRRAEPIDVITVGSVCTKDVLTVSPNTSVEATAKIMDENKLNHIPVVEKEIEGVVSTTDMVRYASTIRSDLRVGDFATGKVVSANENHTINHIISEMQKNDVQKVIIMNNEKEPVGIVSTKDLSADYLVDIVGRRENNKNSRKQKNASLFVPFVAEDIMTGIIVIDQGDSISNAARKMYENGVSSIPVTKQKKVVGLFTENDILTALSQTKDSEI